MAHPNIDARRERVAALLAEGRDIRGRLRQQLAEEFDCSIAAIRADVTYLTVSTPHTIHVSAAMRRRIFQRDGHECQYCGDRNAYEYIIEHIVPAAQGGPALPHNLVVACQACNVRKRSAIWIPRNLAVITIDHPQWRHRIIDEASRVQPF